MMTAKRTRKDIDFHAKVVAAARLAAEGHDQTEIAERLRISQAGVSRHLKEAEAMGWLVRKPKLAYHNIQPELLELAELQLYPHNLQAKITERYPRCGLREARVFDSGSDESSRSAMTRRLAQFGRAVAPHLEKLCSRVETCAVTWGRTLAGGIDALEDGHREPLPKPVRFIPVCGDPLRDASVSYSSSRLSDRLSRIVNAAETRRLSLMGVPAFIPLKFGRKECATVKQLIHLMSNFEEIFSPSSSGESCLLGRADVLLTSVGRAERSLGYSGNMLLKTAGISNEELKELVIGDLGGVLIERPNLTPRQAARLDDIRGHWMGINLDHIRSINKNGSNNGRPGVVVIALGKYKAEIILECIQRALIRRLWIDRDLADSIFARLERA